LYNGDLKDGKLRAGDCDDARLMKQLNKSSYYTEGERMKNNYRR